VWWHELSKVESECTSHNFSLFAIFLPKIIRIGGNLKKFWHKQFLHSFLRHGVNTNASPITKLDNNAIYTLWHTQQHNNRFTALCPGLPRWASSRRNTHPPTIMIIIQSLSASSIYTCPYHRNLFCCSINIISSIPNLSLNSILGTLSVTLTLHIRLTILISARWSATSFSFLTGQVWLPCSILLRTQLLYSLPLLISDISLLVSSGTNCLNLFHPIHILASTAASASPFTLNISPR